MNKYYIALLAVFFKFAFVSITSMPWSIFDPLFALAVIYTFFHSLDMKNYIAYALFCGFLKDAFGLDCFGINMFSYFVCVFAVAFATRIIYRQNWIFIFPMVFLATFLNNQIIFLKR